MMEGERRPIAANGITLDVTEAGTGFPVILCHGFPELAYSWRHQVRALSAAGYRVIASDQRGYGGSSKPEAIEAYDLDSLAGDIAGLMDALNIEKAVLVGHDWGSPVVWHTALTYPNRVHAVASLSVPHSPRGPTPPLDAMREVAGPDHIFYIDYFQAPGVADAELMGDVRSSLSGFMWSISGDVPPEQRFKPIRRGARFVDSFSVPAALPPWLSEDDLQVYVNAFSQSGFTGGLNWYRNVNRNWERSDHLTGAVVRQPALFVTGSKDPARNPPAIERLSETVADLRGVHILEGCGHWTQQERPDEVNRILIGFLDEVAGRRGT